MPPPNDMPPPSSSPPATATTTPTHPRNRSLSSSSSTAGLASSQTTPDKMSFLFRHPISGPSSSPSKRRQQAPSSFPTRLLQNSFDRIAMQPLGKDKENHMLGSPTKKPPVSNFNTSITVARRPSVPLYTQFQAKKNDKENNALPVKRSHKAKKRKGTPRLMDAAPIREPFVVLQDNSNIQKSAPATCDLESYVPPEIVDDGNKPMHSYAQLIAMAILRADKRRLTLAQIYKWIGDTFKFYSVANGGWQNSIRHNLSLNKDFIKQERPKDDPGKGNYWTIVPGQETKYLHIGNKLLNKPPANSHKKKCSVDTVIKLDPSSDELPEIKIHVDTIDTKCFLTGRDSSRPSREILDVFSSDATRSASPEPRHLDDNDVFRSPSGTIVAPSSPIPAMCSSPPVTRDDILKREISTPSPLFPSDSCPRKRKLAMDDSGYGSGFSAMRHEEGKHRSKRGRAEADIERMRKTREESPSTGRGVSSGQSLTSPIRANDTTPQPFPLTPAQKLKPTKSTPDSASPNTNLRMHRQSIGQLVKSPERNIQVLDENFWGSQLAEFLTDDFCSDPFTTPSGSSPIKGLEDLFEEDNGSFLLEQPDVGSLPNVPNFDLYKLGKSNVDKRAIAKDSPPPSPTAAILARFTSDPDL